jgi:integrase
MQVTKCWNDYKGDTIRLRWNIRNGDRTDKYLLSLGVKRDRIGFGYAKTMAALIESDVFNGKFDPTLEAYQNPNKRRTKAKLEAIEQDEVLTAVKLFENYAADRVSCKNLSHSSKDRFKAIASKLKSFVGEVPATEVTESIARNVVARWSEDVLNKTIKAYLFDLSQAWQWGKLDDPWVGIIKRLTSERSKRKTPFTRVEVNRIIEAFKSDPVYFYYTDIVVFLTHCGCRFGEAAGMYWHQINSDFTRATISESISRGHRNPKGTKTGMDRVVELPPSVRAMLKNRFNTAKPKADDLVFPSPKKGVSFHDNNFRNRAWKPILERLGIKYRSPYNTRHTVASHAIENGVSLSDVAEQLGHSKRVLMRVYDHAIEKKHLVDFGLSRENDCL